jgi:hypothetical protein
VNKFFLSYNVSIPNYAMDTGLFFSMAKIIKIEDFKWLHTKNAWLNFFEILT